MLRDGAAAASPRDTMFYYRGTTLYAVRYGSYKAHLVTRAEYTPEPPVVHDRWPLYNLDLDPGEQWDIGGQHPEVLRALAGVVETHRRGVSPRPSLLDARISP